MPDLPYRAPLTPSQHLSPDGYRAAWAELRRRQVCAYVILTAYLLVMPLLSGFARPLPGAGFLFVGVTVVGAVAAYLLPLHGFRCPNCGRRGANWGKCQTCGIRIGTSREDAPGCQRCRAGEHE